MVTLPLERMASRVAASLCYATGLGPHMVVHSQQEYEVRSAPALRTLLKASPSTQNQEHIRRSCCCSSGADS